MDEAQATHLATGILGEPIVALLTADDWQLASARATVAGDTDPWVMAAELVDLLGIRAQAGGVLRYTSEGTTIERTPADWFGMAARLRDKAARRTGPAAVGVVSIGTGDDVLVPRSVADGDGYWTWDGGDPVWWPWKSPELP